MANKKKNKRNKAKQRNQQRAKQQQRARSRNSSPSPKHNKPAAKKHKPRMGAEQFNAAIDVISNASFGGRYYCIGDAKKQQE